ncbi:hypothetical protein VNI00_017224 [Paramarasmius palmivorus]|uniref:Uncharacterized protein n=1 Tax=Paramarasmius palmivorus TaxID=297713 RepID=A0AAW0B6T4_9AGAR
MFKNNYGWGMAHGFFVIMGGFALYDGEKFCGYLWDRDRTLDKADHEPTGTQATSQTLSDGYHHKPFDGKAEKHFGKIKAHHEDASAPDTEKNSESSTCSGSCENLSTADASETGLSTPLEFLVSKGYITLTENEIKDRSHADFIAKSVAVIQTTWFILQVIARAVQGLAITELEIMTVGFAILNFGTYFLWWNKPLRVGHPTKVYWRLENMSGKSNVKRGKRRIWSICKGGGDAIVKYIYKIKPPSDSTIIRLLLLPIWIPLHIFFVCLQILRDNDNKSLAFPISSRLKKEPGHLYIAVYGAAALFGAIHCIPWVFQFLTHTEQSLWRISAIAVAAAPIAVGPLHAYMSSFDDHPWNWKDKGIVTLVAILSLAYAAFRIILIVIAFTSLRYLPPGAYQTVQWTTFIPHVG